MAFVCPFVGTSNAWHETVLCCRFGDVLDKVFGSWQNIRSKSKQSQTHFSVLASQTLVFDNVTVHWVWCILSCGLTQVSPPHVTNLRHSHPSNKNALKHWQSHKLQSTSFKHNILKWNRACGNHWQSNRKEMPTVYQACLMCQWLRYLIAIWTISSLDDRPNHVLKHSQDYFELATSTLASLTSTSLSLASAVSSSDEHFFFEKALE